MPPLELEVDDCRAAHARMLGAGWRENHISIKTNNWIRRSHRRLSIVFELTVIANFAARAQGGESPAWITYSPLLTHFLMLLTDLYLFALPYRSKRRSGAHGVRLFARGRIAFCKLVIYADAA